MKPGVMRDSQAGFTFAECAAGLALMVTVAGMLAAFMGPPVLRQILVPPRVGMALELIRLQELGLRIGRELTVPPWWPSACLTCGPEGIRLSEPPVGADEPRLGSDGEMGVLLAVRTGDFGLELDWGGRTWHFPHLGGARLSACAAEAGGWRAIAIEALLGEEELTVFIPLHGMEAESAAR